MRLAVLCTVFVFMFMAFLSRDTHSGGLRDVQSPLAFGPLQIGMTQQALEDWAGDKAGSCATCRKGEFYLELDRARVSDVVRELATLSLKEEPGGLVVEVFIERQRVETIRVGRLVSNSAEEAFSRRFGRGRVKQKDNDITSIEWRISNQRVVLTTGSGGTDVIVQRLIDQRSGTRGQSRIP